MEIIIPKNINSDYSGYNYLAHLNSKLENLDQSLIVLDFSKNTWFDANLSAILGAIINSAKEKLNQVEIKNLNSKLENILCRNHFLASFGGKQIEDSNNTAIKYRRNKSNDEKLINASLEKELFGMINFPKLSEKLKKEIRISIFEIYSNAFLHGNCEDVYSCGQFYPQREKPCLNFTIADMGKTIKGNVSKFLNDNNISSIESISWALKKGNTTKPKTIPGGLGLDLIKKIIYLNNGRMEVISDNGYCLLSNNEEKEINLDYIFPGTIVNMEFNFNDDSDYYLTEESSDSIIF